MARHVKTLVDLWHVIERKNEKLTLFWHVGTQARGHINHAGTQARWHVDHVGTETSMACGLANCQRIYGFQMISGGIEAN